VRSDFPVTFVFALENGFALHIVGKSINTVSFIMHVFKLKKWYVHCIGGTRHHPVGGNGQVCFHGKRDSALHPWAFFRSAVWLLWAAAVSTGQQPITQVAERPRTIYAHPSSHTLLCSDIYL
jgi:hypothetical protein